MTKKKPYLKTETLKCRVTLEEKNKIIEFMQQENQKTVSSYLRNHALQKRELTDPTVLQNIADLELQIRRIGTNINQLVRSYHAHFFSPEDKIRLMRKMDEILEAFQIVQDSLENDDGRM